MSVDVELLVRDYAEHIDSLSTPVDIDSLFDADLAPIRRPRRMKPDLVRTAAVGVAAFVMVLVVGAALLFMTIGSDRPVATSSADPSSSLSWSRIPHDEAVFGGPNNQRMFSVIAGGPGLVAVGSVGLNEVGPGDAAVWTSVDGISWSRVPHDEAVFGGPNTQRMLSVIAGGPGLVAVGTEGSESEEDWDAAVWTSVDGVTWVRVPHDEEVFGGPDNRLMASVTVGGPGLVAVGSGHVCGPCSRDPGAVVWTSVDGITWSRVPHDEAVFGGERGASMHSVTAGGPGLVAVGSEHTIRIGSDGDEDEDDDAAVWTSVDGITWTRVPHDETVMGGRGFQGMYGVAVGGPGLVAVGSDMPGDDDPRGPSSDAAVWTSVDGISWSRVPHDDAVFAGRGGQRMETVIAAGPGLVAVGYDGGDWDTRPDSAVWTSVDGITWSRVPHDEAVFGGSWMSSVTAAGSGLVAVGFDWLSEFGDVDAVVWTGMSED